MPNRRNSLVAAGLGTTKIAKQFAGHAAWDKDKDAPWAGQYCDRVVAAEEDACSCSFQFLRMAAVRFGKNGEPLLWNLKSPVTVLEEVNGYNSNEDKSQTTKHPAVIWWLKSQWSHTCKLEEDNKRLNWTRWEKQVHGTPLETIFAMLFSGQVVESGTAFSDNFSKPGVYTMPHEKRDLSRWYSCPNLGLDGRVHIYMAGLQCDYWDRVATQAKNEVVYKQRGCHLNHVRVEVRGHEQMALSDQFAMSPWLPLLETNPRGSKGLQADAMKQNHADWKQLYTSSDPSFQFNRKLATVGGEPFPCLFPHCKWPAAEHVDPTTGDEELPEVTCCASHKIFCSMYFKMRDKQHERKCAVNLAESELRASAGVVDQPGDDPGTGSSSSSAMDPEAMAARWGCAVAPAGVWAEAEAEPSSPVDKRPAPSPCMVPVDLGGQRPPPPPPTVPSTTRAELAGSPSA